MGWAGLGRGEEDIFNLLENSSGSASFEGRETLICGDGWRRGDRGTGVGFESFDTTLSLSDLSLGRVALHPRALETQKYISKQNNERCCTSPQRHKLLVEIGRLRFAHCEISMARFPLFSFS